MVNVEEKQRSGRCIRRRRWIHHGGDASLDLSALSDSRTRSTPLQLFSRSGQLFKGDAEIRGWNVAKEESDGGEMGERGT